MGNPVKEAAALVATAAVVAAAPAAPAAAVVELEIQSAGSEVEAATLA